MNNNQALHDYPNLEAIIQGTIAGPFRDWPGVRPELIKLLKEIKELKEENKMLRKELLNWV